MTDVSTQIDKIVREVMRRLEQGPAPARNSKPSHQRHVPGRVVSLEQLERHALPEPAFRPGSLARGRAAAGPVEIRRITVDPGAVVTPAVMDLLRDLGITLAEGRHGSDGSPHARAVIVNVPPAQLDTRELAEHLGDAVVLCEMVRTALDDAVAEAAGAVGNGDCQAVVVAHQAMAAVCLANRHRGVRAAACYDPSMLQEARDTAGINVLALDPARLEPAARLGLAVRFFGQPIAACPAGWGGRPRTC